MDNTLIKEITDDIAPFSYNGAIIDKNGNILGQHKGYPFYTIGQRKGLEIALGKPVFVTKIDPDNNTVMLGDEDDLEQNEMIVSKLNMIKYDMITPGMEAVTRIRYKDKGSLSSIYPENGTMKVRFYENLPSGRQGAKGIAPGQSAVFYEGDDVIGGGIIQRGMMNAER